MLVYPRINDFKRQLELINEVSKNRPTPHRRFDQIYMKETDLLVQIQLMSSIIADKSVLFIGDGDSMSLSTLLLASHDYIPSPKECIVLDFDKRVVSFLNNFAKRNGFEAKMKAVPYNVINPVPIEFIGHSDYFYINPPYGYSNGGNSVLTFLTRSIEGCKTNCSGCIIMPTVSNYNPKQTVEKNVINFLNSCDFEVSSILKDLHGYYLDDNPYLRSSSILVEKFGPRLPQFYQQFFPEEMLVNFYGRSESIIPNFIPE